MLAAKLYLIADSIAEVTKRYCSQYDFDVRVVLDTSVLVSALRSDQGASYMIVDAALAGKFEVLMSVPLALEYEAVLTRPEQLAHFRIDAVGVKFILEALIGLATPVRLAFYWRPWLRDADDDMVLETAAHGNADWLVTQNERDFRSISHGFGFKVATPKAAWQSLRNL